MPRFTQFAAVGMAAVALVVAGCGGDDGGGDSDEDQITAIIEDVGEDPPLLCEHAAESLVGQFGSVEECKQAAEDSGAEGGDVEIDDLTVDGATATATVTDATGDTKLTFSKEDGEWVVSKAE